MTLLEPDELWFARIGDPVMELPLRQGARASATIRILVLLRHAATEENRRGIVIGRNDPPLDDQGRFEAEKLARRMPLLPIDRVFVSDLRRATETAQIICGHKNMSVLVDPMLREANYGAVDGLDRDSPRYRQFERGRRDDKYNFRPEGGESLADLEIRSQTALNRVLSASHTSVALVVAHLGTVRTFAHILCDISARDAAQIDVPHLSLSVLAFRSGRSVWGGFLRD